MSLPNSYFKISQIEDFLKDGSKNIHFEGIFGVSQRALAHAFCREGYSVCGSDTSNNRQLEEVLKSDGIKIIDKLDSALLKRTCLVCYSLSVGENCFNIRTAKEHGIPCVSRAQLLGFYMMKFENKIGISGTHGKSTTLAILNSIFNYANREPTVFSGAELNNGKTYCFGSRKWFLYEGCEYKNSFLHFYPDILGVNPIELDHTDFFHCEEEYIESFRSAVSNSKIAVINTNKREGRTLFDSVNHKVFSLGSDPENDFSYRIIKGGDNQEFAFLRKGETILETELHMLGEHNVENCAMAIALSLLSDVKINDIIGGVSNFKGLSRRMELIGYIDSRPIIYDYAHHPSEIVATLGALKKKYRRVTVIFSPHTYTRTRDLFSQFSSALSIADYSLILDIFPAREKAIEGVTSEALALSIGKSASYAKEEEVIPRVKKHTKGAIVLMGAGDVLKIKEQLEKIGSIPKK